jgi:acetolactate synthase-1/2/3 large subunit
VVIPDVDKGRYHGKLAPIDFVAAAKAHGWDGYRLRADLGNLDEILDACYASKGKSILVDVPIDADQVIGLNPRLNNLTTETYL